jgi:hypothetical protein
VFGGDAVVFGKTKKLHGMGKAVAQRILSIFHASTARYMPVLARYIPLLPPLPHSFRFMVMQPGVETSSGC